MSRHRRYNRYSKRGSGKRMSQKTSRDWARKVHAREKVKFKPLRIFRILRAMLFRDTVPNWTKDWANICSDAHKTLSAEIERRSKNSSGM